MVTVQASLTLPQIEIYKEQFISDFFYLFIIIIIISSSSSSSSSSIFATFDLRFRLLNYSKICVYVSQWT